jgi:hypothetical protein
VPRRRRPNINLTAGARVKSAPREYDHSLVGAPPVRFHSDEPDPYKRYWLERFTADEIHEMGRFLPAAESAKIAA